MIEAETIRRAWHLLGSAIESDNPALSRALAERARRELHAEFASVVITPPAPPAGPSGPAATA